MKIFSWDAFPLLVMYNGGFPSKSDDIVEPSCSNVVATVAVVFEEKKKSDRI